MKHHEARLVSATFEGILATLLAAGVMTVLCKMVTPEARALGIHPALLGIAPWIVGLTLGILHGRAIWKRRPRPQPRGFEVIARQQPSD
jgi:hypothetical protein